MAKQEKYKVERVSGRTGKPVKSSAKVVPASGVSAARAAARKVAGSSPRTGSDSVRVTRV